MKRVTGIGGIFFKSHEPDKLYRWYETHLGIHPSPDGSGAAFEWREIQNSDAKESGEKDSGNIAVTVWSIFPRDSKYFDPSQSGFMVNYRVDNLDALLEALEEEGVQIDPRRENYDYGRFAWIMDPDGNRIELWEPPKGPES